MAYDHGRADLILRHQDQLERERQTFQWHWQEIAEFVLPRSADFNTEWQQGAKRTQRQFDAFPTGALSRFAAAMEAGLIPRQSIWHALTTGDMEFDEDREIKIYLEDLNRRLFKMRYSDRANFASQAHEHFLSLGAFGTAVMWAPERPDGGLVYKAKHLGECYVAENRDGLIDTVHCKPKPTVRQIMQKFGKDAPPRVVSCYDRGDYEERFNIIHCVKPREDYDGGAIGERAMRFAEAYVFEPDGLLMREGGYHEFPYFVSRYVTSPREVYGRSPAMQMLPDIKMANEVSRVTIDAAALAIDPPWLLPHDDVLGDFSAEPGARNYGGIDENGNQLVVPMQTGANPELGETFLQRIHSNIDDAFLGVYFRVLLENPNMTATQAMLIAQQQGQMAQPMIGRQQTEFLGPMIRRESGVMHRQGRAPEPPEALIEYLMATGEPLGVRYESPLVRQARSDESVAIMRTIEQLTPVAQIDPKVFTRFNWSKVSERLSDLNGVPADVLFTEEEMEEQRQAEEQQQQAQLALEAAPVAASAAKDIAQAQQLSQNAPPAIPGLI